MLLLKVVLLIWYFEQRDKSLRIIMKWTAANWETTDFTSGNSSVKCRSSVINHQIASTGNKVFKQEHSGEGSAWAAARKKQEKMGVSRGIILISHHFWESSEEKYIQCDSAAPRRPSASTNRPTSSSSDLLQPRSCQLRPRLESFAQSSSASTTTTSTCWSSPRIWCSAHL